MLSHTFDIFRLVAKQTPASEQSGISPIAGFLVGPSVLLWKDSYWPTRPPVQQITAASLIKK